MERRTALVIMGAMGVTLATVGALLAVSELSLIPGVRITAALMISAFGVILFGAAFFARKSPASLQTR